MRMQSICEGKPSILESAVSRSPAPIYSAVDTHDHSVRRGHPNGQGVREALAPHAVGHVMCEAEEADRGLWWRGNQ